MRSSHRALFTCSILLNLLLLATVGGYLWKHATAPAHPGDVWKTRWEQVTHQLPPEKAEALMQHINAASKESRKAWKQLRPLRREIIALLRAPEFDAAIYEEKVTTLHTLKRDASLRMALATGKAATALNAEERAHLANMLEEAYARPGHRKRQK